MRLKSALALLVVIILIALGAAPLIGDFPTAIDTDTTLLVANDLAQATLASDLNATDASFTVTSASTFTSNMIVKIDSEQIKCTSFNSSTRVFSGCTRGAYGTTAATHSATNAQCSTSPFPGCARGIIASAHHSGLKAAIIAIQAALGAGLSNVYSPTAAINYENVSSIKPFKIVTSLPASCVVGQVVFKSNATPGQNIYLCTATDTWTQVSTAVLNSTQTGIYEADFSSQDPLVVTDATHSLHACPALVAISVDDGTNYTNAEPWNSWSCVKSTFTVTIDFPSSTSGHYWLIRGSGALAGGAIGSVQYNANGTLGGLANSSVSGNALTINGVLNLAGGTFRIPSGTTKPATCTLGDLFADSDETPAGQQVYYCSATNTWSKIGDGGAGGGGGDIDVAAGWGLHISKVNGINQINLEPEVAAIQGGDNEFTGQNNFTFAALRRISANDTSTGTELYKLVSLASTGLVRSSTASNDLSLGICTGNCGTSGNGEYVKSGEVTCAFDNSGTKGNWVVRSTTAAGQCHDSGVASSSGAIPAGFVVGVALETGGSSGNRLVDIAGGSIR